MDNIQWGVYDLRAETEEVHVAPCNEDGVTEHLLHAGCWCYPQGEWHGGVLLVVHELELVA
jgi:hypothetical protein